MDLTQIILTAIYFVFGGVFLFLAFSIIRDNFSARLNRITGMMLFFAALGPVFLAFGEIVKPTVSAEAPFEESIIYNMLYLWELFFPAFLLFSWVYPVDRLSAMKRPKLRYLIFLPHIFHIILVVFFNNPEKILSILDLESGEGFISLILEPLSSLLKWIVLGFTLLLSSEITLFSLINLIYAGLGIYFLNKGRSLTTNNQIKSQTGIMVWGITGAVICYAIAFLVPQVLSIETTSAWQRPLLLVTLLAGAGSVVWSVVTHRFLDITVLVRQSLVYTLSSGILVGAYILLVGQVDKLITSFLGEKTTIVNIAFIVLALILFQPINVQLDNIIKRIFIKGRSDYRHIMEQLSRSLISVLDPEQLKNIIEMALRESLMTRRVYFVLYDDKLLEYVLQQSEDYSKRVIINREDYFLGGVNQLENPAFIDRLSLYNKNSVLYGEMEKRQVRLILPLKDADHLLGFLALTDKTSGFRYNAEDITMLGVMTNQLVTALTNSRLYQDSLEKQRLSEEMNMARQIQLELLPKCPPAADNYRICACSFPSRTIGGDFYDFIHRDDGTFGMVIADASGKGLPAALMVTQIQAMLRSEVANNNDITKIMKNINQYVTQMTSSEKFATLFYGEFNPLTCDFKYSNAGHNYPILVRADGTYEYLSQGGLLIGAFSGIRYEDSQIRVNDNDLIFFYTDGLSEAMNENGEEYGERRIIDYLTRNRHLNPEEIADGILKDKKAFDNTDPPSDDTTLIVLKVGKGNPDGKNNA
ncbi:MAG: GAF domain-containing SpoIIE family protein phosphatase [Candidatus Zixiibacteriota bacterium]